MPARGQSSETARYTLMLRGVPLNQALEELVRMGEIDLIYSSALTEGKLVYCDGRELGVEPLLRCILAGSGLDFVRTSAGTYVVVDARRARAQVGDLAGRIVDRSTGEPLPNANVLLADASVGTTSNDAGFFHFSSLVSGWHRILVTYVGYEMGLDSVRVNGGETHRTEIALSPNTLALEPIIIDGLVERLPSRSLGIGTFERVSLRHASSLGVPDVARTAAAVTGVSIQHPLADLHIQGGGAGEHLTLLDEVPVRDPVTLGRYLSAFSPLAIRRVSVHKAGFGAAHGGHLSGVVRIEHDVSGGERPRAAVLVDPISVSAKLQGRIPLTEQYAARGMISVRTGLWGVYRDPGLESLLDRWNAVDPILTGLWMGEPVGTESIVSRQHRPEVAFSDVHAAARMDLGAFRTLDVSAYRASNRLGSALVVVNASGTNEVDRMMTTTDEYEWTNWTGQARHTWLVSARSAASLQARASSHSSMYRYLSAEEDVPAGLPPAGAARRASDVHPESYGYLGSDEVHVIREFAAEASYDRSITSESHIDLSVEALRIESRFRFGNQFIAPMTHDRDTWHLAAHAEGEWSLGLQTVLEPGVRLTYLPSRKSVYGEPRIAIRHDRPAGRLGALALRIAGGLYRQYIPSFTLTSSGSTSMVPYMRFWLPLDNTLAPPQSVHLAGEVLLMPASRWSIGVEVFQKWQTRLVTLDYAGLVQDEPTAQPWPEPQELAQEDFVVAGSGRAFGTSLRTVYDGRRLSADLEYAYTLAEHRFPNRFDPRLQPVPWSEPHSISASASFRVADALTIYTEGDATWNRSWAFRHAYYDYLALRATGFDITPFSLENPSKPMLPAYYSVNLGLAYDLELSPVEVQFRAALLNVFDRENVYDWSVQQEDGGFAPVARTLPGRRPALSVRVVY